MSGTFPHSREPIPPPPPWWQVALLALGFAGSAGTMIYIALLLFWPRGM
ncbi:hypothetical protein [Falsiroseomonas sp.]|nr:hypothetical protein [Falsiroseomonas sp.]MDO9499003.1 hypothetical protein [Falsiroseomonas sp.]